MTGVVFRCAAVNYRGASIWFLLLFNCSYVSIMSIMLFCWSSIKVPHDTHPRFSHKYPYKQLFSQCLIFLFSCNVYFEWFFMSQWDRYLITYSRSIWLILFSGRFLSFTSDASSSTLPLLLNLFSPNSPIYIYVHMCLFLHVLTRSIIPFFSLFELYRFSRL